MVVEIKSFYLILLTSRKLQDLLLWTLISKLRIYCRPAACSLQIMVLKMAFNRERSRRDSKGPSIKYVTLEGGGGPRRCDSLWQGERGKEHVTSHLEFFLSYIRNKKFKVMFNFLFSLVFDDCICFKGYAVKLTAEIRVRRVCGYRSHSLKVGSLQLAMQSGVNSTGELNIDCRCYHIDGKDQFLRDAASCRLDLFLH